MRLTCGVQRAATVGEEEGRAGEQRAGPRAGLAGLASLGRAAGCEAHFFFSFFLFSVLFHLFEFKSGFGF